MLRHGIVTSAVAAWMFGQTFAFTIGSPVASMDGRSKLAAFVFRTEGCSDLKSLQVGASAEGLADGSRTSVALKLVEMSTPGVYAVQPGWPRGGDWVVALHGTCAGAQAGALVPVGPNGFDRASSKFFAHPPAPSDIDLALRAMAEARHP
jgi:hypothetical protein